MSELKTITVSLDRKIISISRDTYTFLFDNSIVHGLAEYQHTLTKGCVSMKQLISLARKADIPYTLFFAPPQTVKTNVKRKDAILLGGVSKGSFSVNSRGNVALRDIELIVKDLIRKQMLFKRYDPSLTGNVIIGRLKNSKLTIKEQADLLRGLIDLDLGYLATHNKKKSFEYIVSQLETRNIFISQSARGHMPQHIQNSVKFSGIVIRDKKVPFIFINSRDEGDNFEPEGRKIFTIILLLVCLAKGRFQPLSYSEQSKELIHDIDFQITEEILLPESMIKDLDIASLDDLKKWAMHFSITPSALLMRIRRLGMIDKDTATNYADSLKAQFASAKKMQGRPALDASAFKKYNGAAYSKAVLKLVDTSVITQREARRILFQNKMKVSFLNDFRSAL